jgi:hypothetical protein
VFLAANGFELRAPLLSEKVDREANRAPLAVKSFSGEFPAPKNRLRKRGKKRTF